LRPAVCVAAVWAAFIVGASWAGAQDAGTTPAVAGDRIARAVRVETGPVLDGDVLQDPAWQAAPILGGFWQTTPAEGAPATERTEVRLAYDSTALYVGIVNYDRTPAQIISTDARRDASLDDTDSFLLILDTYHDRQNGFVFGTNPAGAEYDGQVANEGSFNVNWDGSWQVRTRIDEIGWTAEFAIPFRTLRYPSQDMQTWGINFQRIIRRNNETAYWAPLTRQYNLHRLSLAGRVEGLVIPPPRNLQLMPYVLSESRQRGTRARGTTTIGNIGGDVKYGVTPSLALDVTINTDFAQVEVDDQQVNLDRFSLFFPEKRPFFLENAGLFSVGVSQEAEVFFSRAIGIGPDGEPIPIQGGARLTGRVGRGLDIGLLNIQTEPVPGVAPSNNFSVARLRRELPNRSALGAMFVNRQGTGALASDDDYNRAYAIDGRIGLGRNGLVSGFVARTQTPGRSGKDYAYQLSSSLTRPALRLTAAYADVGEAFNPEVGFLSRRGFRKVDGSAFGYIRGVSFWRLHEVRPHVVYRGYWNQQGVQETGFMHTDAHWEFRSGHEFHSGFNLTRQGVTVPFDIFPGITVPIGTYDHAEVQPVFFTNEAAPVSIRMEGMFGGFFGGSRRQWSPSVRVRLGDTFDGQIGLSRNDIDLPWGEFSTNLWRSRVSYSFTSRVFLQGLIQYNDRARLWSSNLRFGWLGGANTGLFLVYNDTQGLAGSELLRPDRSVTIKLSRLINLLD
jgi:hypothetical protein